MAFIVASLGSIRTPLNRQDFLSGERSVVDGRYVGAGEKVSPTPEFINV